MQQDFYLLNDNQGRTCPAVATHITQVGKRDNTVAKSTDLQKLAQVDLSIAVEVDFIQDVM